MMPKLLYHVFKNAIKPDMIVKEKVKKRRLKSNQQTKNNIFYAH